MSLLVKFSFNYFLTMHTVEVSLSESRAGSRKDQRLWGNPLGSFTKSLAWRLLNPQGRVNYGYLFHSILFPHFSLSPSLLFPSLPSFIGSCYIQLCLKTVFEKPSCLSLRPQGLTGPLFSRVIVDIRVPDLSDIKYIR